MNAVELLQRSIRWHVDKMIGKELELYCEYISEYLIQREFDPIENDYSLRQRMLCWLDGQFE